jgi:hypothetical protein
MYLVAPRINLPSKPSFSTGSLTKFHGQNPLKNAPNVLKSIAPFSKTFSTTYFTTQSRAISSYTPFFKQDSSRKSSQQRDFASETASGQSKSGGWFKWIALFALGAVYFIYSLKPKAGGAWVEDNSPKNALTEFQDTRVLFQNKSTAEIWFNLIIFKFCSMDIFVELGPKVLQTAENLGLAAPIYFFIKRTFYSQFCAGN